MKPLSIVFIALSLSIFAYFAVNAFSGADTASRSVLLPVMPGRDPYDLYCRQCHGVEGVPPAAMQAKYPGMPTFDRQFARTHSQDSVFQVLTWGRGPNMPSFDGQLTAQEIQSVAAYVYMLGKR